MPVGKISVNAQKRNWQVASHPARVRRCFLRAPRFRVAKPEPKGNFLSVRKLYVQAGQQLAPAA